jgi:4-alpha-glucanotransferase
MDDGLSPPRAGILLHVTSLPSGRLDDDALRWLDWLAGAGIGVWQLLPLVIPDAHGSPYQSASAFATNPALLGGAGARVNDSDYQAYCADQAYWLDDFAMFAVLKQIHDGRTWTDWPEAYRRHDPDALSRLRLTHSAQIHEIKRRQFLVDRAWHRVRQHANGLGITLFGDIPIFVAHDSADTWSQPQCFLLDAEGQPDFVTGVPPDYFSATGQRWGNPHYRWDLMAHDGFSWWKARIQRQCELFDSIRIDHFRGLSSVWMIEADSETAIDGYWQETPGDALLTELHATFPTLDIVAEDLGVITDDVRALRKKHHLLGMAVLQFAFDAFEDNPHKPANVTPDTVFYTGTHDNDTSTGWFAGLEAHERDFVFEVLQAEPTDDIAGLMLRTTMASPAVLAMAPLQDHLGLGSEARMNTPGVADGNWRWRFTWDMLGADLDQRIRDMTEQSGRLNGG